MTEQLIHLRASQLLDKFGAGNHKPGSGSAAAFQGMLAARLLQTVISLTIEHNRTRRYADQIPKLRGIDLEIKSRIIPSLERLFQEDSDQFDNVIQSRLRRDNESDPVEHKRLADQAKLELVPATEMPIQIAKDCVDLAKFALYVFDNGFQSAQGDSGVALNAAISGVAGCLSIVELNLQRFDASDWTGGVRASRDDLMIELETLNAEARKRRAAQVLQTERKTLFSKELQAISALEKGKKSLPESDIEALTVRLQRTLWNNRNLVWKSDTPESAFEVLNPYKALECFDLIVRRETTLGQYPSQGETFEVAGQIDQSAKVVSISEQFPKEIQNFTAAHELGHYLLHTQPVLHRDRPLNRPRNLEPRLIEEWQADKFAAYFLMPTKLVKTIFTRLFRTEKFRIREETAFALGEKSISSLRAKCRDLRGLARLLAETTSYNGTYFHSLCAHFNVSPEAMAIRLEELQLLDF